MLPVLQIKPQGESFREFITLLYRINAAEDDVSAHGMRRFQARPKYILRKLAFSILPEGAEKRDKFVQEVLLLGHSVCTQQRRCVKDDLFVLLNAICDHCPELACIPANFCRKEL